jgi:penicillin-insensitive murein endopeptidase
MKSIRGVRAMRRCVLGVVLGLGFLSGSALAVEPPSSPEGASQSAKSQPARMARVGRGLVSAGAFRFGRSVGSPTEGHLVGGARLEECASVRICPAYAGGDVRWGLEPLVGMLERASKAVRRQFSDAVLTAGHLSRPGGGEVDRHHSHESGRDADVAFFVRSAGNKPFLADRFIAFRGDGLSKQVPGVRFDDARNWAFVSAVLNDSQARVSHIFVAAPLRARLLAYAARIGVSPQLRHRAAEVMMQPKGALPHDDHFHVRIACPSGMGECIEMPTAAKVKRNRYRGKLPPTVHAHATKPVAAKAAPAPAVHEHGAEPDVGTHDFEDTAAPKMQPDPRPADELERPPTPGSDGPTEDVDDADGLP